MTAANENPIHSPWNDDEPPHNRGAEQAVIGAVFVDNAVLADVQDFLRAEHFADPSHAKIFRACQTLIDRGETAGPLTLKSHFDADRELDAIGGQGYLAELAGAVFTTRNARDMAREVHDCYLRRQTMEIAHRMMMRSRNWDLDWSGETIIEHAERDLVDLRPDGGPEGGFMSLSQASSLAVEHAEEARRLGKPVGIQTGLAPLDDLTGGLHRREVFLLGARPSMGKTGLLTSLALNMAERGYRVAFFSLEETAEIIAARILARKTGIDVQRIRKALNLSESDVADITEASRALNDLPLYIDDTRGLTIPALSGRARKLQNALGGLDVILLDHLRKVRSVERSPSPYEHINEISEGLTVIADTLDVPLLVASQLSRGVEGRDDKRPSLADLRDSGRLEEDARTIAFLYREAYYEEKKKPKRQLGESEATFRARHTSWEQDYRDIERDAELIVAKQNNGPLGNVDLRFDPHSTAFEGVK